MTTTIQDQAPSLPSEIARGNEKPQRRSISWGTVVAFGLLFALLGLLAWGLNKSRRGPLDSGLAPDFTLTGYDGRIVTLSKLRGQVVIINFWASWCQPCREEAAYLEQTWRKYKDQGVVFIGVDYADTDRPALAYLKEFDITYLNGPDLGTRISQAYNIKGVPETYYVAKNGELRGVQIGPLKSPQLDDKINELLQEP
jgi:cytochrome c biogenesis protein CcmG/thiol:disulfide interchange protein DsbE